MWHTHRGANKYGAIKTEYQGRVYDSKFEARVAADISLLVKSGDVISVETQRTFDLYGKNGNKICSHRPDWLLTFKDSHQEVWEAKGVETAVFRMKLLLFTDNYPQYDYFILKQTTSYYAFRNGKRVLRKRKA